MGFDPTFGMINSMLHPERGYKDAEDTVNQSWGEAKGYMDPYNQAGKNALPGLQGATDKLLDPTALQGEWMKSYETSPWAKDEMARSQTQGLDAASAMGLSGSSAGLENIQRTGSSIVNADRQNYLNDLMQKYQLGVGSAQNIFGTGAGMAQSMGHGALQTGENAAAMRYGQKNAPGEMYSKLLGMAAGAVGKM
jgi:hypothetical protein